MMIIRRRIYLHRGIDYEGFRSSGSYSRDEIGYIYLVLSLILIAWSLASGVPSRSTIRGGALIPIG